MSHLDTTVRQLLFVQGGGEGTHDDWDAKLVASLRRELGPRFDILYPRMPREDDPSYARWKPALLEVLNTLREGAALVGHSVGATILLHVLAEQLPAAGISAVILIAPPFVGEGGWPSDELQLPHDLGARLPKGLPIHLFHGLQDESVPVAHAELFARSMPQAHIHRLPNRNHQLNDDLSEIAAALRNETAPAATTSERRVT